MALVCKQIIKTPKLYITLCSGWMKKKGWFLLTYSSIILFMNLYLQELMMKKRSETSFSICLFGSKATQLWRWIPERHFPPESQSEQFFHCWQSQLWQLNLGERARLQKAKKSIDSVANAEAEDKNTSCSRILFAYSDTPLIAVFFPFLTMRIRLLGSGGWTNCTNLQFFKK